ncbi:MAG TPA: FAD-dependent oxidoreductase [Mycobacteriales bacterium]|jgi:sarcosine oxidase subunit beta|nr:FAD-dependent oxidoreductase [Mycobacteriales bacterium]
MRSNSAVVIGAGVIGGSVALALARAGIPITILDRAPGPGLGSTSASSAIVRFHYSTYQGVAVSWEAKHGWEDWPAHLGTTDPAGMARYIQTGTLVLDTPGYDAGRVLAHYDRIGIPYEVLSAAEIRARFPYLSPDRFYPPRAVTDEEFWAPPDGEIGGFYCPQGGFVDDPGLAAHNLWAAATAAGASSVFRAEVAEVRSDDGAVSGVTLVDGRRLDASIVVNAAGPHSAAINALAGVLGDFALSTRPLRQEVHSVGGPAELAGELGPSVGDSDLGTYYRFAPGGSLLVGSQEPDCDPLEWLEHADDNDVRPTVAGFERQTLRLARRMPSVGVPNRPVGHAGVYDVTEDWIPIYDKTGVPGYFVAIGTSGNQFKNAPVVGQLVTALITDWLDGGDHDTSPVSWTAPRTGAVVDLSHYSRLRAPNADSSNSVLG